MEFSFRPLPPTVTLMPSDIEGMGLFAADYIRSDEMIGISHVENKSGKFHNNLIRTPIGGFINHSETPNCTLIKDGEIYYLFTTEEILPNHELVLDFRLHPCGY